jgi:hypothetical protein
VALFGSPSHGRGRSSRRGPPALAPGPADEAVALPRGRRRFDTRRRWHRACPRSVVRETLTDQPRPAKTSSPRGRTQPRKGRRRSPRLAALIVSLVAGNLAAASTANASICLCAGGQNPTLRVNAKGFAEVSWASQGSRHFRVITPRGRVVVGRMRGPDVSRPTTAKRIPYKRVLRRTPSGAFWALQSWARPGEPRNLRFSRWRGRATHVTAETFCCRADARSFGAGRRSTISRSTAGFMSIVTSVR